MGCEIKQGAEKWEVYIIRTTSGTFYTGIAKDPEKRLIEHSGKRRGAKFFRFSAPEIIVFREAHESRSAASVREVGIKRMNREEKLNLIRNYLKGGRDKK